MFLRYPLYKLTLPIIIYTLFSFSLGIPILALDVKFNNAPLEEEKKVLKRRTISTAELERKQLEEEKYQRELHEQRYKRLMHLLNQSKFYSNYLKDKIKEPKIKAVSPKKKKRQIVTNENVPPNKLSKIDAEEYDMRVYLIDVSTKKILTSTTFNII